jgi:hypothetical protein
MRKINIRAAQKGKDMQYFAARELHIFKSVLFRAAAYLAEWT